MSVRTGIGYDSHRFAEGRALILGGVRVEHETGLDGHSDADVLTHAVIDAILGAAGLGDIGQHFPDTDERFRDANSMDLLREVAARISFDWRVEHVDTTLVLERPKIGPYREAIAVSLAEALGITVDRVNLKATTGEGMGFVGRGEGAAALAVATLVAAR